MAIPPPPPPQRWLFLVCWQEPGERSCSSPHLGAKCMGAEVAVPLVLFPCGFGWQALGRGDRLPCFCQPLVHFGLGLANSTQAWLASRKTNSWGSNGGASRAVGEMGSLEKVKGWACLVPGCRCRGSEDTAQVITMRKSHQVKGQAGSENTDRGSVIRGLPPRLC